MNAEADSVSLVGIDGLTVQASSMLVDINQASKNGQLIDYNAQSLDVDTSISSSLTLDMEGTKGELIQISGNLEINVFDFFTVNGGFAFVKTSEVVTLADGSEAEVDLLTLGGNDISAFAGLNGGSSDQLGFVLSGVSFGLAIMSDKNRDDRSWWELKGNVGSLSFEGVDGLEIAASNFFIDVNQYTGATDASTIEVSKDVSQDIVTTTTEKVTTTITKTNTVLALNLKDTLGQVSIEYNSSSSTLNIEKTDSDAALLTKITSAFETLLGSGNVLATGTKANGFYVEFNNALNGSAITDFTLTTQSPTLSSSVVEISATSSGVSEVQILTIDATLTASGRYVLSFDGQKTKAIRYAGNDVTNNAKYIRQALEKLSNVGTGNVSVVFDQASTISSQKHIITFKTGLAKENLSLITVDNKGLRNATVSIAVDTEGIDLIGETQRISISTETSATYKITLNVNSQNYTTANISNGANAQAVQDAINNVLDNNTGLHTKVVKISDGIWDVTFQNELAGIDVATMTVSIDAKTTDAYFYIQSMGETKVDTLTQQIVNSVVVVTETITVLETPADLVVDFNAKSLDVITSSSTNITLDMDGARGNLISASGTLNINVFNFFQMSGNFALEKYETQVTLSDGSVSNIDLLTLGGENITSFVGMDGGTAEQLGFEVSGVDFALALMTDQADSSLHWTSLKASATNAMFVGLSDDLIITSSDLSIEINKANKDGLVVDFLTSPMAIKTSDTGAIEFDFDGAKLETLSVSGNLDINVYNFFQVSGGFSLNKSTETMTLSNGSSVDVDLLTLGATNVSAFVGINGGTDDELGFKLENSDFALSILKEKGGTNRKWTSLHSNIGLASFVGVTALTIEGTNLSVQLNQKASDNTVIDYQAKSLDIKTSASTNITFDFDGAEGDLLQVSGGLKLQVSDFVHLSGNFALKKSEKTVTLNNGDEVQTDALIIAASGVDFFAGINYEKSNELGLKLTDGNFALALLSDKDDTKRSWTAFHSSVSELALVGISGINFAAQGINVDVNTKADDGTVVDFGASTFEIEVSPTETLELTESNEVTRVSIDNAL
ncbi:hypothetical protein MJH12_07200, partial [bacterium]|nr:hypothetical protein [bacterium]